MNEQILALLKACPLSTNALCAALKALPKQVKPILAQMLEAEQIALSNDGRYKFKVQISGKIGKKSMRLKELTTSNSQPSGITIKQACQQLGVSDNTVHRRLIQHDLLEHCVLFRGIWYVPDDILALVSAKGLRGYTQLSIAAKTRGVEPLALLNTLNTRGFMKSKVADANGQIHISNSCLVKNDRLEKHLQTLQPDERDRRNERSRKYLLLE